MKNIKKIINKNLVTSILTFARDKKTRYLLSSILFGVFLLFCAQYIQTEFGLFLALFTLGVIFLCILVLAVFLKYVSTASIYTSVLPLHLIAGYLFTLFYFPSLGFAVKFVGLVGLILLFYIILLVNNIFLVIQEKSGVIPLYTVALTWVQILIITISIPYFSGVYKIVSISLFLQSALVVISTFLFSMYMIWCVSQDEKTKKTVFYEKISVSLIVAFITFCASICTAFFPTESFLRGLFVSSILLFGIGYIQAHYKNRVTTRLMIEYSLISGLFFAILLIFHP